MNAPRARGATAFERITDALRADGRKVTMRKEGEARAKCPAHNGSSDDSLSVRRTDDRTLIHCHSGCDRSDVLTALGMTDADLFDDKRTTYVYTDHNGTPLRSVVRSYGGDGKRRFSQAVRRKDDATPLYRLPAIVAAPRDQPIYLVEGEEDVHAVEQAGGIGTTAPQGAGNFRLADVEPLRGRVVVAIPDRDGPGGKWAATVADKLKDVVAHLEFRQARVGKDFADHYAAGGDLGDLEPYEAPQEAVEAPSDGLDEIRARLVAGGSFILDTPEKTPSVWGRGTQVLWAEGEALVVAGPSGVGKTTTAGQVVRGLILGDTDVLGLPVTQRRRVLYLAMDRPKQAARALRRTLGDIPRDVLDERLVFWPGPPVADIAKHPETLLALAEIAGADVVIVDSLKDAAVGLKEDEVGAGYNRARQMVLAAGIDVLELHHLVKRGPNGGAPKALADLFGSVWITAGAGSVVLLWGEAGDPIVELRHLKQPAEEVGPFKVEHDHETGTSTVWQSTDLVAMARRATGVTAKDAAMSLFDKDKPTPAEVAKARRKLSALVRSGELIEEPGNPSTNTPAKWRTAPVQTLTAPLTAPSEPEPLTAPTHPLRVQKEPQVRPLTATLTPLTPPDPYGSPPSYKEGGTEGHVREDRQTEIPKGHGTGSTPTTNHRAADGRPLPCPEGGLIFHRVTCSRRTP